MKDRFDLCVEVISMFFKQQIDVTVYEEDALLIIKAIRRKTIVGKMTCVLDKDRKTVNISDIICKKKNNGYGTKMMQKLIEVAKQQEYVEIDGWLSAADTGHMDMLHHFYQKFGFEIIPNTSEDEMRIADIKLVLK